MLLSLFILGSLLIASVQSEIEMIRGGPDEEIDRVFDDTSLAGLGWP